MVKSFIAQARGCTREHRKLEKRLLLLLLLTLLLLLLPLLFIQP